MTLKVWRLIHARWVQTALSGEGASRYPGRWNRPGERMVYLGSSLALAVLETRVHLEVTATQQPYMALEFELPVELVSDLPDLPENWREAREITREIGSRWLQAKASLALRVPSAIVPTEPNYLLNPLHPQMPHLKPLRQLEFIWDDRLF